MSQNPALIDLLCQGNPVETLKLYGGYELIIPAVIGGTVKLTEFSLSNKQATLTATADSNYTFDSWTYSTGRFDTASNPVTFELPSGTLTVTSVFLENAETPTITAYPKDGTYTLGTTAIPLTVSASVTDNGTLSYAWYKNTQNNNTGGTPIPGTDSSSYTPPTDTTGKVYYYCVVANTNNNVAGIKTATAISDVATIEVNASGTSDTTSIKVNSVALNTNSLTMIAGDRSTLKSIVLPSNAKDKNVKWNSTDTGVATISNAGVVEAKKAGTTQITATSVDGSNKSASCTVKVYAKTKKMKVRANGYTLNKKKLTLQKGKKVKLNAKVDTKGAMQGVTFKSSNKKIASVGTANGLVKGRKAGTAKIVLTSKDGKYKQTYTVKVVKKADRITSTFTYRSKNSKIAKINKAGEVTGKKKGRTVIVVKNGKAKKEIKVVVK